MAFVMTLLYVATTLLSPGALPQVIAMLHVSDILGILTIVTAVWSIGDSKILEIPATYLGIGLLLATTISMLATGWISGAITTFLGFVPILFTFYFVAITCNTLRRLKILVFVMVMVAFYVLAQCTIAEYTGNFTSPYLIPEGIVGGIMYRFRGMGVISDPNDLAQILVTLTPLLWLRWKKDNFTGNLLFTLVPAAILAAGVYFTHSRGGAIALIAALLFGFKDKLGVIGSTIFAGCSMALLLALNVSGGRGMGDDDGGRVAAWATGLIVLKSHPILGIGPGNFGEYNSTGHTAHNSFILALSELGFVGYFFWMGMIVACWTGLSQVIRTYSPKKVIEDDATALARLHYPGAARASAPVSRLVEAPVGGPQVMTRSINNRAPLFAAPATERFAKWTSMRLPNGSHEELDRPADDELAYAARIIRISFVGLLTAGFFLSRTYAVSLYIMLGMAISVIKMPNPLPPIDIPSLMKKIGLTCLLSAVFLYVFVRLHGGK
jgi:O-antigen ligase